MEKKMTSIGGQAIIEGVMMRGPKKTSMAVRKNDGEIVIEEMETKGIGKWAKIPLVRGVVSFVSSMVLGVKALMFSAKFFDDEENDDKLNKDKQNSKNKLNENNLKSDIHSNIDSTSKENSSSTDEKNGLSDTAIYVTVFISILISVLLFISLPNFVADLFVPQEMTLLYNVVENVVKIIIFLVYLLAVSKMEDIKRVFEYHGAEHKSIFCYENGEELTIENVRKHSRFHPRCGTSFLLFVILVSIVFFSFLPRFEFALFNVLVRLLLMPVVAGVSYEIIKFAGKSKNKCIMLLNKPGMWLQRLTTREPDDSQIEVAIMALKAVIPENGEDDRW